MASYLYKARDKTGKVVRGILEAATREDLTAKLHNMGYLATEVREAAESKSDLDFWARRLSPLASSDRLMFYVELASMIGSGMGLLTSLRTLEQQTSNRRLKETLGDLARGIESGDQLSQGLSRHPYVFPAIFVSMARVGEATGKLDSILLQYANFSEAEQELKEKIQGALTYPMILLAAGTAAILFIVTFIIPQFSEIFLKAGVPLPALTQALNQVGLGLRRTWVLGLAGAAALWVGVVLFFKTPLGRLFRDRTLLKLPVAGELFRRAAISRFTRTLGTLASSGVPILQSLDIAGGVMQNAVLERVVADARLAVERGERLAEPLKISGEFPPDVVQMIAVGDETGNLEGMLKKVADFYDMALGYTVKRLTTFLETFFLLVMGVLMAFIMASLLLPIFEMTKILRR